MKKKSGLKKEKKKKLSNFKFRTALVIGGTFLAFGWIILILFYIQIVKGEEYKKDAEKQYKSKYTVLAKRGRIISNDGEMLAFDGEDYGITLDPTFIRDESLDKLMDLFKKNIPNLDTNKLKSEIISKKKSNSKYLKIDYKLGYNERKIIEDELDEERWDSISTKRIELIKDGRHKKCICTKLKEALKRKDYDMASNLQREMVRKTEALGEEYRTYALNIID